MIARTHDVLPPIPSKTVLDMNLLTFGVKADGTIHVTSPWLVEVRLDPIALMNAERRGVCTREGHRITFQCANGGAEYQIVGTREGRPVARLVREWV